MHINEVSQLTGLSAKAIRFYEQRGIVSAAQRQANGYRVYSQQHLSELRLLKQARNVGFTLDECRELILLMNNPARQSAEIKARTVEKIHDLERQMKELQQMHQQLVMLAESCPGDDGAECPIIRQLSSATPSEVTCCQAKRND